MNTRLPELNEFSLEHLLNWISDLKTNITTQQLSFVNDYIIDIETKVVISK